MGRRPSTGVRAQVLLLAALAIAAGPHARQARATDEPEVRQSYRDWSVYAYRDQGRTHCYLASKPVARRGEASAMGDAWLLVASERGQSVPYSVSFEADRPLSGQQAVRARIGKRVFELAAEGTGAWTTGAEMDLRLIVAMKRGRRVVISATTEAGAPVLDSFSLMGFTRALDALGSECR